MPVLPAWNERFTTYAVDRRGRGLSGDAAVYALEREFDDVVSVVDSIGSPVDLFGHSYGGLCAMEAALRTSNVRRLILYEPAFWTGTPPVYSEALRSRLAVLMAAGEREEALRTFFKDAAGLTDETFDLMKAGSDWFTRLASAQTFLREHTDATYAFDPRRFGSLDVPVLLLCGSESPAVLQESTAAAHAALPNSRLIVLDSEGHNAIDAAPAVVANLVIDFLA